MAERILVVGGSGLIGQYVFRALVIAAIEVVGTYFRHARPGLIPLDASQRDQVAAVFDAVQPTVMVNAANMAGGTDGCERDPERAMTYHFGTTRNLADACRERGCRLVHVSTDYIFDGRGGPYREEAVPKPISIYGRVKLYAEDYIRTVLPDALILRTTFVFDWDRLSETRNFIITLIDQLRQRQPMVVPVDQVGNPTLASNFAYALKELVELGARGVFNVSGTTRCSRYDWAVTAAKCFGLDASLIRGVTMAELGQAAPRPLQAGFILDKALSVLRTPLLSLPEALEDMKRRMARGA